MVNLSLIPELEEVLRTGSADKRARTLRKITDLFVYGSPHYNEDHVKLFDDVLGRLIEEIEVRALAELSTRLAPVDNAPVGVVQRLASDDDISVAGPLLKRSRRLADSDLAEIARSKGQDHLLAISERSRIGEAVTDILVTRGDQTVARRVAANRGAKLSEKGFGRLVDRAESDDILAMRVGQRSDIPAHIFRDLLLRATEVVQKRLLAAARPETRAEIIRVLAKVSREVGAKQACDFRAAQETVLALQKAGRLDEPQLAARAAGEKFQETAAALSLMCAVPIEVVERLMTGEQSDPVLILCKAAGFDWSTAQAVVRVCAAGKKATRQMLDDANANFELLSQSAAQRVVRFWQAQPPDRADTG